MRDPLKSPRCFLLFLALSVCLICISCDDSSTGGGKASGEEAVQMLDSYKFSLLFFDKNHNGPFSADLAINSAPAEISVDTSEPITGTYLVKEKKYTINGLPTIFTVTINMEGQAPRAFTMQLTDSLVSTRNELPTDGEFRLIRGGDIITVTINPAPKGAYLKLNSDKSEFFKWDDLDNLLRTDALDWKQDASLAASLMSLLMDQVYHAVFTKECMDKYKLRDGEQFPIPSSTFPPGSTPVDQDNLWLTWTDTNKDKVLGGGDDFTWIYSNSWENDPYNNVGNLYSGKVDMKGYTENIGPGDDDKATLMSFGFTTDTSGTGIFYDDLDIAKTMIVLGSYTIGTSLRLNGGFWIDFTGNED